MVDALTVSDDELSNLQEALQRRSPQRSVADKARARVDRGATVDAGQLEEQVAHRTRARRIVLNEVAHNDGTRWSVEKLHFVQNTAAAEQQLIEIVTPVRRRDVPQGCRGPASRIRKYLDPRR